MHKNFGARTDLDSIKPLFYFSCLAWRLGTISSPQGQS